MSKVDLDFTEFTDKPVKKEAPIIPKQEAPKDTTIKPTGYIVGTRKSEDGKIIPIDIADLSGEEFLKWAATVYPGELQGDPKEYENRATKVRVLENIIKFHESGFMTSKRPNSKDLLN